MNASHPTGDRLLVGQLWGYRKRYWHRQAEEPARECRWEAGDTWCTRNGPGLPTKSRAISSSSTSTRTA